MWMSYVKYPEVLDLKSGIKKLQQLFGDIAFDADHEALCGMEKFYSKEYCYKRAAKYREAEELCNKFLQDKNLRTLILGLKKLKLLMHLKEVKIYLPIDEIKDIIDSRTLVKLYRDTCI